MAKKKSSNINRQPINRVDLLTQRINHWSRRLRIVVTSALTIVYLLIFGFILDRLIADRVYNDELSIWVPSIIITVIGVGIYAYGWFLLVGFDWDAEKPWIARRASAYFVIVGLICSGIVMVALLGGLLYTLI